MADSEEDFDGEPADDQVEEPSAPAREKRGAFRAPRRAEVPSEHAQRQHSMRAALDEELHARLGGSPPRALAAPRPAPRSEPPRAEPAVSAPTADLVPSAPKRRCAEAGCPRAAGITRDGVHPDDAPYCSPCRARRRARRARGADPNVRGVKGYATRARGRARKPVVRETAAPRALEAPRSDCDPRLSELLAAHAAVRALGGLDALERVGLDRLAGVIAALGGAR